MQSVNQLKLNSIPIRAQQGPIMYVLLKINIHIFVFEDVQHIRYHSTMIEILAANIPLFQNYLQTVFLYLHFVIFIYIQQFCLSTKRNNIEHCLNKK